MEYYGFDQVSVSNPKPASFENRLYDDREFIFAHHYLRINVKQVQIGHKVVLEFS